MKIRQFVLYVFTACCLPFISKSQFKDAVIPAYSYGINPVFSQNTGNDIMDIAGQTFEVSVSDDLNGNNAMLYWNVAGSIGFTPIGSGISVKDPDVCLVNNSSGSLFAVTVYFDVISNEFMWQVFPWSMAQQQFIANAPVTLSPGFYNTAINIDSDDGGTFAIVWDEPGSLVRFTFGQALAGLQPQLYQGGQILNLEPGSEPDVCVYRKASNNYRQMDVVYKNTGDFIAIDFYKLDDLLNGTLAATPAYRTGPADLVYRNPRIACPGSGYGEKENFTVVVEDSDNSSTWYIKGFNSNLNSLPQVTLSIYNDGNTGNSPYDLTIIPNINPVVCYDDADNTVWVAWTMDNSWGLLSAPGASVAKYPIALCGDRKARVIVSAKYLVIPTGTTFSTSMSNLSMAGNKSGNVMFTFDDNTQYGIYSKTVPHQYNAPNLKVQQTSGNIYSWLDNLSANQEKGFDTEIIFTLHDMTGKELIHFEGSVYDLVMTLDQLKARLKPSLYLVKACQAGKQDYFNGKIFLGR